MHFRPSSESPTFSIPASAAVIPCRAAVSTDHWPARAAPHERSQPQPLPVRRLDPESIECRVFPLDAVPPGGVIAGRPQQDGVRCGFRHDQGETIIEAQGGIAIACCIRRFSRPVARPVCPAQNRCRATVRGGSSAR